MCCLIVPAYALQLQQTDDVDSYTIDIKNEKIAKRVMAADSIKDNKKKMQEYLLIIEDVKKMPSNEENAYILAVLYYVMGEDFVNAMNLPSAASVFYKSYETLKSMNLHKNNIVAFRDLYSIYCLTVVLTGANVDPSIEQYLLNEIITTQTVFEKKFAENFWDIYRTLAVLYKKQNDIKNAEFYAKKAEDMANYLKKQKK